MKLIINIFLFSFFTSISYAASTSCQGLKPLLVKPIENWDIIAVNKANIDLAPYFSGGNLIYAVTHNPIKKDNTVSMNPHNGILMIDAQKRDDFDLKITATNRCGVASSQFNVQIDEEQ